MNHKRKALVIGVSGQDGTYLAKLLLEQNYDVVGTSRDVGRANFAPLQNMGIKKSIKLVSIDSSHYSSVEEIITQFKPDEIYNLAGQSSVSVSFSEPIVTFDSITIAVLNVLEVIRINNLQVKFYNAGSGECFGNTDGVAVSEVDPFKPQSPYAVAKSSAAWLVKMYRESYGLFACTGLLFNHESPLRPERFVTQKVVAAAHRIAAGSRERLTLGNIEVQRDWGWAPEYVEAMWAMLHLPEPVDLVIATGRSISLREFVATVFTEAGLNWEDHVDSDETLLRPTEVLISRANCDLARSLIQWAPQCVGLDVPRRMYTESKPGLDIQ